MIAGDPAEIRINHLLNTSLKLYHYTSLFVPNLHIFPTSREMSLNVVTE